MESLCRLCAKEKTPKQLAYSINDEVLKIKQKLIECCRWDSVIGNDYSQMPDKICNICFTKLETTWEFVESITKAQEQLFTLRVDIKTEVLDIEDENVSADMKTSELVEEFKIFMNSSDLFASSEDQSSTLKVENFDNNIIIQNLEEIKADLDQSKPQIQASLSFLCEICGKDFTSKSNLITHAKMHLPLEQRKHYACYICKMIFSYKKSMIHHMQLHSGKKIIFQCAVCLSHFSRKDALQRHSLIHLGKLPHQCQTCGKGFRTKFNLKVIEIQSENNKKCSLLVLGHFCRSRASKSNTLFKVQREKSLDKKCQVFLK